MTRLWRSNLRLFQRSLCVLPVDHAEGDALWFGGEGPADGGAGGAHADGDDAVAAGLDEELPGTFSKPRDVVHREGRGESAGQETVQRRTSSDMQTCSCQSRLTEIK